MVVLEPKGELPTGAGVKDSAMELDGEQLEYADMHVVANLDRNIAFVNNQLPEARRASRGPGTLGREEHPSEGGDSVRRVAFEPKRNRSMHGSHERRVGLVQALVHLPRGDRHVLPHLGVLLSLEDCGDLVRPQVSLSLSLSLSLSPVSCLCCL